MFYLRPGNLYKDFRVERPKKTESSRGRQTTTYVETKTIIHAALAKATPDEIRKWETVNHPITHTIVQQGKPQAYVEDRLTHEGRQFYIQGMDPPGEIGICTLYYVQERTENTHPVPEEAQKEVSA